MSLRESLNREREEHKLISIGALKRLVTESFVQACLSSAKNPLELDLVSRTASHCPNLFAMLALLELECYITKFPIQGLGDRISPVALKDVPAIGREKKRADCCEAQWYIPPRLNVERHIKLPQNTILPFFRREGQRNGAWGLIDKVIVLEGRLAGWPGVSYKT